jgi:hypothetical protein
MHTPALPQSVFEAQPDEQIPLTPSVFGPAARHTPLLQLLATLHGVPRSKADVPLPPASLPPSASEQPATQITATATDAGAQDGTRPRPRNRCDESRLIVLQGL